jgi:hypothetical protein
MRVDLHVHSKFSTRPSPWILQKIGCPESFTDPLEIYRIAKSRGMTLVTITDHNRIDGALEIAHLPDTFISEEITSYFPEDRCKIHVLALNISEKQHTDIQKVRENLYELVQYLRGEGIIHIAAHPLYSVNDRLTLSHVERLLLLFKNFEMNGARDDDSNSCLHRILSSLTEADINRLSDKYGIAPGFARPWEKTMTGGSDDHSSLNIARTYTEIQGGDTVFDALAGIAKGDTRVIRRPSTPLTLSHNLYGIAYQFYRTKFRLERYTGKDVLMNFLDRSLRPNGGGDTPGLMAKLYHYWQFRKRPKFELHLPESIAALIRYDAGKLLRNNPDLMPITNGDKEVGEEPEKNWFRFANHISNRIMVNFASHLLNHLSGGNVFNIFHTIGSGGGLSAMLAPYFISFASFAQDRAFNVKALRHFGIVDADEEDTAPTIAHFADPCYPIDSTLQAVNQCRSSGLNNGSRFLLLTCSTEQACESSQMRYFQPVGTYEHPDFPEAKVHFPPLLEMLDYCYAQNITRIHSATPGPVGLAALAVARILKLPVYGAYHPHLHQFMPFLAGDESADELLERYLEWYYEQLSVIFVFRAEDEAELIAKGIKPGRIKLLPLETGIPASLPRHATGSDPVDAIAFQTLHANANATVSPLARAV